MNYFYYFILWVLPSFVWLLYFLRKDVHPESNKMILKVFLYGMLITLPAILLEAVANKVVDEFLKESLFKKIVYYFLVVSLIEEFLKYLVVRKKVLFSSDLDEPIDVMLYLIISALGFAAFENILYLIKYTTFNEIVFFTSIRFVSAIFLHALCSGLFGYFLALSFYHLKEKTKLMTEGFVLAVFFHAAFNYGIIEIGDNLYWIFLPIIVLISLATIVSIGFQRLKKLKSVCKIE